MLKIWSPPAHEYWVFFFFYHLSLLLYLQLCFLILSAQIFYQFRVIYTGMDKSRFIIVSMQNTVYFAVILLLMVAFFIMVIYFLLLIPVSIVFFAAILNKIIILIFLKLLTASLWKHNWFFFLCVWHCQGFLHIKFVTCKQIILLFLS